jgi:hypothetical protein
MKNRYVPLTVITIITCITHWVWLKGSTILSYSDWGYTYRQTYLEFIRPPTLWQTNGLGSINIVDISRYPIELLSGILALSASAEVIEHLVIFYPLMLLMILGSFFMVYRITKSPFAAVVGSLVYSFNTYFLIGVNLILLVAYALFPFIFILYHQALKEKRIGLAMATGLVAWLASAYEFRAFYIMAGLLFSYFLYFLAVYQKDKSNTAIKHIVILGLLPFFLVALLNSYWLLPLIKLHSLTTNDLFSRELFGNAYMSLPRAMTLFHPFWTGHTPANFVIQPLPWRFWIIPIAAFFGLWLNRKNRFILFFGLVSIVGILLTKQVDHPFVQLYPWLYDHWPGFNAYREASKFYFLIALGYSVLIASLIAWLEIVISDYTWGKVAVVIIGVSISTLFLWNTKPLITQDFGTLFIPRHIPASYPALTHLLVNEKEFSRTLWVPRDSRWGIETTYHPKVSLVDTVQTVWNGFIQFVPHDNNWPEQDQMAELLHHPYMANILNIASVKYVVVPVRDVANDDDFFIHYGNNRDFYINLLNQQPYLKPLDLGPNNELKVYENNTAQPYITAQNHLYQVDSLEELDTTYQFVKNQLGSEFNFTLTENGDSSAPHIVNVFDQLKDAKIAPDSLSFTIKDSGDIRLFTNQTKAALAKGNGVAISDEITNTILSPTTAVSTPYASPFNEEHFTSPHAVRFEWSDRLNPLVNLIPNPSFESGLWQTQVGDCNNYDKNPILGLNLSQASASDGQKSLQLEATRHIACTGINRLSVTPNTDYIFRFDYQGVTSKEAGYYLSFDDPIHTVLTKRLPTQDTNWHNFHSIIHAPAGSSHMSLTIYSYDGDHTTNIITRYDNFQLVTLPDLQDRYFIMSRPNQKLSPPNHLSFETMSPYHKQTHIAGATQPFYLTQSERFNPGWKVTLLRPNSFLVDRINPFFRSVKLPTTTHLAWDNTINAWYIDVPSLCQNKSLCQHNSDGSANFDLSIDFAPQHWLNVGSIVSLMTLFAMFVYGLRMIKKKQTSLARWIKSLLKKELEHDRR